MVLMGLRGGGIASVAEERCVFEAQLLMEGLNSREDGEGGGGTSEGERGDGGKSDGEESEGEGREGEESVEWSERDGGKWEGGRREGGKWDDGRRECVRREVECGRREGGKRKSELSLGGESERGAEEGVDEAWSKITNFLREPKESS